jgi:hypothetical protein
LASKPNGLRFVGYATKLRCSGLLVTPQNRQEDEDGAGHISRCSGLLCVEVSWAIVSQSILKTSGDATRLVHVASSQRSR